MSWILALPASVTPLAPPAPDLLAIRARRAESITDGTLEHAVILIEDGKIAAVGEDLPIERGIPIWDLPDGWVVLPGLVDVYSRLGLDGQGANDSRGFARASDELWSGKPYEAALEEGVTTLALYPAGNGIPGKAVAVRTKGATPEGLILTDDVYLKIVMRSNSSFKRNISDGFDKADEHIEKEKKNREKWEKEQEKKKKKSTSKKDEEEEKKKEEKEEKEEEKKEEGGTQAGNGEEKKEEGSDEYQPLEPDPKVEPFLRLRDGSLRALIGLSQASDYLHLVDAIDDEEFAWDLRLPLQRSSDYFHVLDPIVQRGCRIVLDPELTLHPGTMRQRNLPAEFARAGVPVIFIPRVDGSIGFESWRRDVGVLVGAGLDRQTALRAMTLTPAELLGLDERLGSISVGKDANLVILDGDPFEPATRVKQVFLEGELVHGEMEVNQ